MQNIERGSTKSKIPLDRIYIWWYPLHEIRVKRSEMEKHKSIPYKGGEYEIINERKIWP